MRLIALAAIPLSFALGLLAAEAQQPASVRTIGWLSLASESDIGLRQLAEGLRELGWVEGQNLRIERGFADWQPGRLRNRAKGLVELGVEVLVAGDSAAIEPAREVTSRIPIVMTVSADPVGYGFVLSLARPGGNITGLSNLSPELAGKRLELLKESITRLAKLAVLGQARHADWETIELAASVSRIKLQVLKVEDRGEFERAFKAAKAEGANGLIVLPGPVTNRHGAELVMLAARNRLPTMYAAKRLVEVGGLIAYGPHIPDLYRRAATYVDKILKGAKPADLPVEQPRKFELAINLRTAKALGLTIPKSVMLRADQMIE
jgi:putative ABC transport system substrate-binding protein